MTIRTFFVVDGVGALLSAVLLGAVLPRFEGALGLPAATLRLLAGVATALALWSLAHAGWAPRAPRLHATAIANGGYCALTAALLIAHRGTVTGWGLAYFACEMGVILALARMEWCVATARRRA